MFRFDSHKTQLLSGATAILLVALLESKRVAAAPCCGGASSLPALMTGDDRAQVTASISQSSVVGDAPSHGTPVFRTDGDSEVTQTFRLDGSYLVTDEFQAGLGLPLTRRSRQSRSRSASAWGLGDVTGVAAYEFLPEHSYSSWKPKGFVFLQTTLPTSPSVYDATDSYLVDARGRGFFSLSLGSAFTKSRGNFDFLGYFEVHRSFPRTFELENGSQLSVSPGYGGSFLLGAGYSPNAGNLRLGISISPTYEGAIRSTAEATSISDPQFVWNVSFQAGYLLSQEWSASAIYTDQTFVGPVKNVSLSRAAALSIQKRWEL